MPERTSRASDQPPISFFIATFESKDRRLFEAQSTWLVPDWMMDGDKNLPDGVRLNGAGMFHRHEGEEIVALVSLAYHAEAYKIQRHVMVEHVSFAMFDLLSRIGVTDLQFDRVEIQHTDFMPVGGKIDSIPRVDMAIETNAYISSFHHLSLLEPGDFSS